MRTLGTLFLPFSFIIFEIKSHRVPLVIVRVFVTLLSFLADAHHDLVGGARGVVHQQLGGHVHSAGDSVPERELVVLRNYQSRGCGGCAQSEPEAVGAREARRQISNHGRGLAGAGGPGELGQRWGGAR